jgi:hypothetical protein
MLAGWAQRGTRAAGALAALGLFATPARAKLALPERAHPLARVCGRADEHGGLPSFVVREVQDYLDCGVLQRGCITAACRRCGFERELGLSCKHRGFCPSCCGRRMNDLASHLVDAVLPQVPIRHWICTLPWPLRYAVGYDKKLCAAVFDAFVKELMRSYKRRAKRLLGLASMRHAHTGTVTFVQRFDSALRLSPHGHVLALDGVYVRDAQGALSFHPLPEPSLAEVHDVAARTATRIERALHKLGRYLDEHGVGDQHDELADVQPVLAACYKAAASGQQLLGDKPGQPLLRLLSPLPQRNSSVPKLVCEVRGVNVHAQRVVDGRDRRQLERLCRYLARPPLSHDRLSELPDGRLRLALKSPWADGSTAIVLHPLDLVARLCALVPPPGFHLTRYAGVLASHASLRPEVIYKGRADPELLQPQLSLFDQSGLQPAPAAELARIIHEGAR